MKTLFGLSCKETDYVPGYGKWIGIRSSLQIQRTTNMTQSTLLNDLQRVQTLAQRIIRYDTDQSLYGTEDYWATPDETLAKRAGDCEDFAIVKWSAMADMGYPHEMFAMCVLHNMERLEQHAVLVASVGDENYILDNLKERVYLDGEQSSYVPLYAYGMSKFWTFL